MATFRTRARAVDLLGKQQIRDEVTAISELLRNSYDADASYGLVDVDSNKNRILIIDDGEGMMRSDIENKWLTIGTYSKFGTAKKPTPKGRVKIGEKGIGRLAISLLGDLLMIISKNKTTGNWTLLLLHWQLFRNENVFLEDIQIPIREFVSLQELEDFLSRNIRVLLDEITENLVITNGWDELSINIIKNDTKGFKVDQELNFHLRRLERSSSGTVFYIAKLDSAFDWTVYDKDSDFEDETIQFRKRRMKDLLFSFQNELDRLEEPEKYNDQDMYRFIPRININGRKLEDQNWFNEINIKYYDYALRGEIVEGQFYGTTEIKHLDGIETEIIEGLVVSHGITKAKHKDCGPIKLKFYFLEGRDYLTSLSKEQHTEMYEKLKEIGGIYVYRDGLRILPYGEPGNDFLLIEKRRTGRAGTFLFSFRRMFGYIEIGKERNKFLVDKSSREGFIENEYFNYFRSVCINLLLWWATEYLGTKDQDGGRRGRRIAFLKQERDEREKARKKREKEEKEEKAYRRELEKFLLKFDSKISSVAKQLDKQLREQFTERGYLVEDYHTLNGILAIRRKNSTALIDDHLNQFKFKLNDRYPLPMDMYGEFEKSQEVIDNLIAANKQYVESQLSDLQNHLEQQLQKRISSKLKNLRSHERKTEIIQQTNNFIKNVSALLPSQAAIQSHIAVSRVKEALKVVTKTIESRINEVTEENSIELNELIREVSSEMSSLRSLAVNLNLYEEDKWIEEEIVKINNKMVRISRVLEDIQKENDEFDKRMNDNVVISNISSLLSEFETNVVNSDEVTADSTLIGMLKKEVTMFRELSAVGLAAELTSHEFDALYQDISRSLDTLIKASTSPKVSNMLNRTRNAFLALEKLHQRMSPLYRQTRSRRKEIKVKDFVFSVIDYFSSDLNRYNVKTVVDIPDDFVIQETETTLFTPLVNLISNAIYWLINKEDREIHFLVDVELGVLYVQDSGPDIRDKDKLNVFEPYFTKRVDGRGLGLFLSKNVLESRGHRIDLLSGQDKPRPLSGACFAITLDENSIGKV